MTQAFSVEIKGLDELLKKFGTFPPILKKHLKTGMARAVRETHKNILPEVPVFTARLKNSLGFRVTEEPNNVIGTVGTSLKSEVYPKVMEFGASPFFPPPSALIRWVHIKINPGADQEEDVAFLVARRISKVGIQGRHFMSKGFDKSKPKIREYLQEGVAAAVKEMNA